VLIPRVFHQIWVGPDPFPEAYSRYQQTWLDRHPGWELRFWREENLPDGLRRPEAADKLRAPAERANILRLELLWRFGGVYTDTDFECLRSIEPLIEDAEIFISLAKPDRVDNALMGSVAGHPVLDQALEEIRPRQFYGQDKEATGARFLDKLFLERPRVTLIAPEHFYPRTSEAKQTAYGIHHTAHSRKDTELLRLNLLRAERKKESAKVDALKWRGRYERADLELAQLKKAWPYRLTRIASRATRTAGPDEYADLHAFCLFVGYPRSGHSLIGSLLDAHPEVVIAHEANALALVSVEGAQQRQLFDTLADNSARQLKRGRRSSGYSYVVEGQWQGRARTLRVIGDKDGQKSASRISREPEALVALQQLVRVPVQLVHVTRNPYDTIARMALTTGGAPEEAVTNAITSYTRLARSADELITGGKYATLTVRHESFATQPKLELRRICAFLGLTADDSYLDACAHIVIPAPRRARDLVEWSDYQRGAVEQVIDNHSFFRDYSWSSVD
jgi:hypothetical protein